jgi:hypothetical protein
MRVAVDQEIYPLTPTQQGMLFHHLSSPRSGVDLEQVVGTLREELDVLALTRAWARVVSRHATLRTTFSWREGDGPRQRVHGEFEVPLQIHDWRELSREEQNERCAAYLRSDRERGFDLLAPPLMRLALLRLDEAEHQLVWSFPHLLLDGRSFPLVLGEVFGFYEAFRRGEELQLPAPRPFREYVDWLEKRDPAPDERFWRTALRGFGSPTPLPGAPTGGAVGGGRGEQEARLS